MSIISLDDIKIIKKDGTLESFNIDKVIKAIKKSSERVLNKLTDKQIEDICFKVKSEVLNEGKNVDISEMHNIVETILSSVNEDVAKSYRDYRNYKQDFVHMLDKVYQENQRIMYLGDKENSNVDSSLVSTKRSLICNELSRELYKKFFLTKEELKAVNDGYIYVHDMNARLNTMNCSLFNITEILKGGFEMGNLKYSEPNSLSTAFDVIADIASVACAQQYGGWTIPEIDKILEPYAVKSYNRYYQKYINLGVEKDKANKQSLLDVKKDFEQGFQGLEYKFNSVGSSRGDYPFVTITSGLSDTEFGIMCNLSMLKTRKNGQGEEGHKKPVLFPKIVFLYDKEVHSKGKKLYFVYQSAIECSSKCMYPDFLSLSGDSYVAKVYKKYGKVISPMSCRAFLSLWFKRGGEKPADKNDEPVFEGRFNIGVISLHLPMILAKSRQENIDFYEVLDYYLNLIRKLHIRTYEYLGEMKASTHPLGYCEGGFYGGHLNPSDKIKPLLKPMTASFGITALNELQQLYNHKSLVEDGKFALEVMEHINKKIEEFKEEDGWLYAIYAVPAENLCLDGDTEIQCYPVNKKIKDIKEGDLVYSLREDNLIELKPVTFSGKTKDNSTVVKVTLDNGQEVICSPEHLFAVRTRKGSKEVIKYISAINLTSGMSIKSNYIREKSGRPYCSVYHQGRVQPIHEINARYFYGERPEGYVIHHKDENKYNNLAENLIYITDKEHRILHMKDTILKYCKTSEGQMGKNNSFYGKHHSQETKEKLSLKKQGSNNPCSKPVVQTDLNFNLIEEFPSAGMVYSKYSNIKNISYALRGLAGRSKYPQYNGHYNNGFLWFFKKDWDEMQNCTLELNHKVVSVDYVDELRDLYDIEVKDNHNFFIGGNNGMLVHNCGVQVKQFRQKYGIIENVSDKEYVSNGFHCHVTENITPIEKQDYEKRFWDLCNGGKIQYVKYPIDYNTEAMYSLVERAMDMGFYEGINMSLSYCNDCGHEELNMDVCPKCGSKNLTKIDRMNGYLSYSRVNGDTRLNSAKMAEIKDRKSM